jgi:hypothetical protein
MGTAGPGGSAGHEQTRPAEDAREPMRRMRSLPVGQVIGDVLFSLLNAAQVKLGRRRGSARRAGRGPPGPRAGARGYGRQDRRQAGARGHGGGNGSSGACRRGNRAAGQPDPPVRPAAKAGTADVPFTLPADVQAGRVASRGQFNDWRADSIRLERGAAVTAAGGQRSPSSAAATVTGTCLMANAGRTPAVPAAMCPAPTAAPARSPW